MPPLSRGTKIFHSRSSSPSLFPSRLPIFCLLIGIAGLIVGLVSFTTSLRAKSCNLRQPRSVSVVWERGDTSTGSRAVSVEDVKRHKVMGFVGVFTGFGSVGRRRALRQTWFPSDKQGLERLEEATGLAVRFVIGKTKENWKMAQLQKEVAAYDDFLLLDMEEHYNKLPYKTLAFFKAAYALYDSEFYVKADDDIYLRPGDYYKIRIPKLLACFTNLTSGYYFTTTDRLSLLLVKERSNPQTYIGCMKKGPVFTDPNLKWHEPLAYLLGSEYFLHAYGPIYALSASVVRSLGALRNDSFRMFSNEDVTIGSWMLAMNVNYENEKTLCEPECTNSSIAVWDIPKCSGLCDPEKKMPELHKMEACSNSPTLTSDE